MRFDEMFKEMQEDKIDALYDGVYKWHKTTEELPPVGCYVLAYVQFGEHPHFALARHIDFYEEKDAFKTTQGHVYFNGGVTHWTHLPDSPEAAEAEVEACRCAARSIRDLTEALKTLYELKEKEGEEEKA